MYKGHDRELGMGAAIARRDFLNGVGVALTSSLLLPGDIEAFARLIRQEEEYYPPTRTGIRGSHPGSFEVAHALRDGARFENAADTGERYDMVVVGAGLSGLSAGYFFHENAGRDSRVLLLDNHDDFGGHAKRNEFWHEGRMLLEHGGTSNMEITNHYSTVSRAMLKAIGVDFDQLITASRTDGAVYREMGLGSATFFNRETFGEDRLVMGSASEVGLAEWLAKTPLAAHVQRDVLHLEEGEHPDYLPGLSDAEKTARLAKISQKDFLLNYVKIHPDTLVWLGGGLDMVSALDGAIAGSPVYAGLNLKPYPKVGPLTHLGGTQHGRERVYEGGPTVVFPDGNATIARLLVRALIPDAVPGSTMEDVITSHIDYSRLDRSASAVRLRLNSMGVRVRHLGDPGSAQEVEITYVREGKAEKVRAAHVVLACYNNMIPRMCPEMSVTQREALAYGEKRPMGYTSVLIRNWEAFAELGVRRISTPGMFHPGFSLGRNQVFGNYVGPRTPADPMVLFLSKTWWGEGDTEKEQIRNGRADMLATTFADFERYIREEMSRSLASTSFDVVRDILAITVNRWPHGPSHIYNTLFEPLEWSLLDSDDKPNKIARRSFGRISIANSDAAATSHTDAAIDEGYRAVGEQMVVRSRTRRRTASSG